MRTRRLFPSPLLLPATRADIPRLVDVCLAAERPSVMNFLSLRGSAEKEAAQRDLVTSRMEKDFGRAEFLPVKALDPETHEIAAFALWQLHGYDEAEDRGDNGTCDQAALSRRSEMMPALFAAGGYVLAGAGAGAASLGPPGSALSEYIQTQAKAFAAAWLAGTKFMYLALLMTHPDFQRRGHGSALLDWGHRRADHDHVPLFLCASPVGHPLYLKVGWKDVAVPIRLELDDWVEDAGTGDMGWGTFRFYWMLRLPKKVAA